jgi:hypothetical protein
VKVHREENKSNTCELQQINLWEDQRLKCVAGDAWKNLLPLWNFTLQWPESRALLLPDAVQLSLSL